MKTAVVSGAYGFIGRHLTKELSRSGIRVTGVGHGNWNQQEWSKWGLSAWHCINIGSDSLRESAAMPDYFIHCAGSGAVGFSLAEPALDFKRNVDTTLTILEYIRTASPGTKFVLASSAGVYGQCAKHFQSESDILNPISPYGIHKLIAERLCHSYSTNFGLNCAIIRLFSVYGAGLRKQLLWDACQSLLRGNGVFGGTGSEERDWINVEDAARLMRLVSEQASPACPVFNGGTGTVHSIRAVIELLADHLSSTKKLTFTGQVRPGDPTRLCADTRIIDELGWRPSANFRQSLIEYSEWFRSISK